MKRISTLLFLFLALMLTEASAQTPAFPGAEGGGMYTTGGRGGEVYFVTSLDDTNTGNYSTHEGTLRWCLGRPGKKTIIFRVAGIIALNSRLDINDNTTIAGQTAPGDGICLKNYSLYQGGSNVIVRYIRSRMGDEKATQDDAMWGRNESDIIIDHCSLSWSTDECGSFYDNKNFTLQWCILSESLRESVHEKGTHGYGGIWGGQTATFHHNLLAHHDSRNPRMNGSRYSGETDLELVDFRNNVIYNWGGNSGYAGMGGSYNFVNNYYKAGPESSHKTRIFNPNPSTDKYELPAGVWGVFYVDGNIVTASSSVTNSNWLGIEPSGGDLPGGSIEGIKSNTEFEVPYVHTHSAEVAYETVLDYAGASYSRDSTDMRVTNEVRNGLAPDRASNGTERAGLIDTQEDVGGWETYSYDESEVPVDNDRDGMADDWEDANGLNKEDPSDRNIVGADGYTMLEKYINSLVAENGPVPVQKVNSDPKGFSIYPNPASSQIHLTIPDYKSFLSYSISDLSGKTVQKDRLTGALASKINITALDRGIYFFTISDGKRVITKRFVKQ
ncbi:T9SS type A sorting domain-containing protein [Saccharicrinis sp. FJH54]|uniref:T9SS type A sorting domain-containing protein n=1 Tax=Saccharicrinis sp. FJH54 TaxID=3344665 RepID=UPI0035D4A29B